MSLCNETSLTRISVGLSRRWKHDLIHACCRPNNHSCPYLHVDTKREFHCVHRYCTPIGCEFASLATLHSLSVRTWTVEVSRDGRTRITVQCFPKFCPVIGSNTMPGRLVRAYIAGPHSQKLTMLGRRAIAKHDLYAGPGSVRADYSFNHGPLADCTARQVCSGRGRDGHRFPRQVQAKELCWSTQRSVSTLLMS